MKVTVPAAFVEFHSATYPANLRWVTRLVGGDHHDAEEILQDSYFDLFTRWDSARKPAALMTTIVKRRVIKYWKRHKREAPVLVDVEEARRLAADRTPPAPDPAVLAELRDELRRAMAALSPAERHIVVARAAEHSTREIADQLDVSARQVLAAKVRLQQRVAPPTAHHPDEVDWAGLIHGLPGRQRQVMVLAMLYGLKPAAIASRLDITGNTARSVLSQSKRKVAAMAPIPMEEAVHHIERILRLSRALGGFPLVPIAASQDLAELREALAVGGSKVWTWRVDGTAGRPAMTLLVVVPSRVTYMGRNVDFDARGRLKAGTTISAETVKRLRASQRGESTTKQALPKRRPD
ncbi:RNA polymerase sigma factor (sigma-70 family) [Catenulispora sp. GP43]|uniref:sigma-70 family RNA polymerase sigma factor n=1 Tax=Catenulispora sp. GP43 TaxID=3156263 RepID=UPI0035197B72